MSWICRVHGNNYTVDIPCESETDAEVTAFEHISRGIRDGNRIYPNNSIVMCELVKVEDEDDGA